jgi:hypothetical protein
MTDDLRDLKDRISNLSDEELIEMVTVAAADYREEALDYAKVELENRGVDWTARPPAAETEGEPEPAAPPQNVTVGAGPRCVICGGRLRAGTLLAEKELTVIFTDNHEERFVRVMACVDCGQLSLSADYDTEVGR